MYKVVSHTLPIKEGFFILPKPKRAKEDYSNKSGESFNKTNHIITGLEKQNISSFVGIILYELSPTNVLSNIFNLSE